MAAVPTTLTETLDNLYSTTWRNRLKTVRDNIFDSVPFWFWMRDKGRLKTTMGGRDIAEPIMYAKTDGISWITKSGTVSLNDFEFLTTSKWPWRYLVGSIVRFFVDDQQNRSKAQIVDFMSAKMSNVQNGLSDELERALFQASGDATNQVDGLQLLVADDPTAVATVGGITQNDNAFWQNKTRNETGKSFATLGVTAMRTIFHDCSQNLGSDKPDIIVSGQAPYERYEDFVLDSHYRVTNNKLADAGFDNQSFKGIPMIWSPRCANTRMYFLNSDFLTFRYDPIAFFEMTEWKAIPDQVKDRAAQIITACAFTVSRRRAQGVIFGMDTA
jgi:hypothetical protein